MMGVMGNKGGVGIRLRIRSSSLCFISCHLAAHRENVKARNENYHKVKYSVCVFLLYNTEQGRKNVFGVREFDCPARSNRWLGYEKVRFSSRRKITNYRVSVHLWQSRSRQNCVRKRAGAMESRTRCKTSDVARRNHFRNILWKVKNKKNKKCHIVGVFLAGASGALRLQPTAFEARRAAQEPGVLFR